MKKSFTLIELLISVVILSILFLALSNVISYSKNSGGVLEKRYEKQLKFDLYMKVLYYDLLNGGEINVTGSGDYSVVKIRTSNSLHFIPEPYVVWYVSKKHNTLMRLESPEVVNLLKLPPDYYLDKFVQNVKIFKIYVKDGKYFIYMDNGRPIYFEMYKGF
ncbi:type II secretion system protein [Nautilia sp.]